MAGGRGLSYRTLLDVATLKAHLGDAQWCIVDVRHQLMDVDYGERVYAQGHLPGAHFLHCDRDLSSPLNGRNGRHPLPDPVRLAQRLGQLSIGPQTQVVVYDDAQGMIAGRLWWLLRWLGHDKVAVLDGGLQAWLAAGGALTTEVPALATAPFSLSLQPFTVDVVAMEKMLGNGAYCLIDGRAPDRFRGENETIDPVGGHIPGAVNRFFRDNLQADGCFKPAAVLATEWQAILGEHAASTSVHYCGSGVSACHNLLALEIAGLSGARLYGGSWSEWCADTSRPVAR